MLSRRALLSLAFVLIAGTAILPGRAADRVAHGKYDNHQVARGKYLVTLLGCGNCHTPGSFFGKPDMAHVLSGGDVAFEVPDMGTFMPRNLTPDRETGLGNWSTAQIAAVITTGKGPEGRVRAPAMPWMDFAVLSKKDALAIAVYLKSLPPVNHAVPGPWKPNEKVPAFVYRIEPGAGMTPSGK